MRSARRWMSSSTVAIALIFGACGNGGGNGGGTQPTTGSVAGQVASAGSGVAGAQIALTGAASRSATTPANGQYQFDHLATGQYNVAITVPSGFELAAGQTAARSVQVQAGQTARVDWEIRQQSGGTGSEVRMSGTSFSPAALTITRGTTVRWISIDMPHTVTPDNPAQAGVWTGTGLLNAGETFEFTFNTPGTYSYHCQPHRAAGMTGTIIVQ
jgi:plastocyanin